jgi:hypothetical protein
LCASGVKSPVCLSCSDPFRSIARSIFLVHREVRTMNLYQKRIRMNPVNMLNILTKILGKGKSKIPDFERGAESGGTVYEKRDALKKK